MNIMQEDVYIGHTALALSLGLQVFGYTGATNRKDGGIPLNVLSKDTTSNLAGLFSTLFLFAERQAGELSIPFFKVFWYDST